MDLKSFGKSPAVLLCLFLAVFLLYSPSLRYGFIFDDNYLIVKNNYIKHLAQWPKIFTTDIFRFSPRESADPSAYYRPLQSLSYALEYNLWKLNPAGYRLTNIAIHSLNAFLFFLLLLALFKDRALALSSALVFSLLPIHPCLVTFIAGRSDLLQTLFFLLALLLFCRFHSGEGGKRLYLFSLLCFVLALLAREGALLLPLFLGLCVLFMNDRKKGFLRILPYVCLALAYVLLRQMLMPCDKLRLAGFTPLYAISEYFRLSLVYFRQLVLPLDFQLFLQEYGLGQFFAVLTALFALLLFGRGVASGRSPQLLGTLFFFAGLLPLLLLTQTREFFGSVISEHYAYIASFGYSLLLSALLARTVKARRFLLPLVLLPLGALTAINSMNYRDERTFNEYILRHNPDNAIALTNLADYHFGRGELVLAERLGLRVLQKEPDAWSAYLLMGNIARARSDFERAREFYEAAMAYNPLAADAAYSLAVLYFENDRGKALEYFKKAFELDPDSGTGLRAYGDFLLKNGKPEEAVKMYRRLSANEPGSSSARIALGVALALSGSVAEARQQFGEALRIDPGSAEAYKNLGAAYGNAGDFDRAIEQWRKALAIEPGNEELAAFIAQAEKLKGKGN